MILHVAYQDLLNQMFFLIAFARARGQNLRSRSKYKIRQLRGLGNPTKPHGALCMTMQCLGSAKIIQHPSMFRTLHTTMYQPHHQHLKISCLM